MPQSHNFPRVAAGAAVGLIAGLAIPHARKAVIQGPSIAAGGWVDALAAEHRIVEGLFARLMETTDQETMKRDLILMKIATALTKHGVEEENVVYPALRGFSDDDAMRLAREHGDIKTFIYDLKKRPSGEPGWLATAAEFRNLIERHIREEEDEIFPDFRESLTDEENQRLAVMLNWEGYKVA